MRVIAGKWKGTKLYGGHSKEIRPLTDRIKESIFGILGERVVGASVLDLFAGSGSFGIEALSRGSQHVVFCEKSQKAIAVIRKNLEKMRCDIDDYKIVHSDVFKAFLFISEQEIYHDLIFVDPPFRIRIGKQVLSSLSDCHAVTRKGILIYRHHKKEFLPEKIGILELKRQKLYGESIVKIFHRVM